MERGVFEFEFNFDFEVIFRTDLPKGGPQMFCATYKVEEVGDADWIT